MPDVNKQPTSAGIYLHIPFCKQACIYCNFHFSTSLKYKTELLDAMHRELALQRNFLGDKPIETIYFGGGTPSLLSAEEINRLYDTICKHFNVATLQECTLEANPDDLKATYLKSLRNTPINRFSIGVQSFHEQDLRYMKRAHNASEAEYAIKAAQDAGFDRLSIDLIYGVPGLSDDKWKQNLNKVTQLQIPHFSAYALTVEEKTALHHAIVNKKATPIDAAQAAAQFEQLMMHAADMGFEHYEISNLATPGGYAIHNTNYWRGLPYLGVGPSAHSFDGNNVRRWNVANNIQYTNSILKEQKPLFEEEILSPIDRLNEYIMTSLRTQWGCDLNHISNKWGPGLAQKMESDSQSFRQRGQMTLQDRALKLTQTGKMFADSIAADMFHENPDN